MTVENSRREEDGPLVAIGRVTREWGLKGEVLIAPMTFDAGRFADIGRLAVEDGTTPGGLKWLAVRSLRFHKGMPLAGFEGIETPEDARRLRGVLVKVARSESPELPEGVYYQHQIIGLEAVTADGEVLGRITSIIETGSNDVYVVAGKAGELLIPAIKDVVKEIDPESGRMVVEPMDMLES